MPRTFLLVSLLITGTARADDKPMALGGLDPVHLAAGEERAGRPALVAEHGGLSYRFASERTRSAFRADPDKHGVQLGGACAVMRGARGNPELHAVHEGRIYLFGSERCRASFQARPERYLRTIAPLRVAIVVYDGVELLDFTGPGEGFAAAGAHGGPFEPFTVGVSDRPITSQGFVTVTPAHSMRDSPKPDVLVIPGGGVSSLLDSPEAMTWIGGAAANAKHVLSVCNGALVLARLGLLDGLAATTHHGAVDALRRESDAIRVREGVRFVDNGKLVTSAGVSAGIDAALHLVARIDGEAAARETALYMEYDWTPPAPAAGKNVLPPSFFTMM